MIYQDGNLISVNQVKEDGWKILEQGNLCGKPQWHWETYISPDEQWIVTFYYNDNFGTIERYE